IAGVAACHPVGLAGESCKEAPCEAGLTCVAGICKNVPPPPPPPPPCTQNSDCVLNGSADGRTCDTTTGTCGFSPCFIDQQCGTRICDQGNCADNTPCFTNADCSSSQICNNGSCRSACTQDSDCPSVGQFALEK